MTLIADWAERPTPVEADATIDTVRRMFLDDPALSALPVVARGAPAGLVSRTMALAAEGELTAGQPVSAVMAMPRLMPADTAAADALERLIEAGGCADGVILVEHGQYVGLITQSSLLRALQGRARHAPAGADPRGWRTASASSRPWGREIRTPMSGGGGRRPASPAPAAVGRLPRLCADHIGRLRGGDGGV